jgi:TPR repeat protein
MALFDKLIAGFTVSGALKRGIALQEAGDLKTAFKLLSKAAKSGLPEAEFRVGRCYLEGAGVPASRPEGVRWVERAGSKGYVEAQALLATLCLHGMAAGQTEAGPGLGGGLFGGQTQGEPDYAGAAKWARLAAEGGSAEGQAVLGYLLTAGPEDMRNPEEGDAWYKKSAMGGCPQGQLGYALILARDTSNPETQVELLRHLAEAADKGLATALYLFGMVNERGVGLPQNRELAAQCYRQAAIKGHRGAQARWGFALMEANGVEANPTEGESWLRQSAAELYRSGRVVPPRRRRQPSGRGQSAGDAASDRRGRAARSGGGGQAVPDIG